jgi:hypothetical protein
MSSRCSIAGRVPARYVSTWRSIGPALPTTSCSRRAPPSAPKQHVDRRGLIRIVVHGHHARWLQRSGFRWRLPQAACPRRVCPGQSMAAYPRPAARSQVPRRRPRRSKQHVGKHGWRQGSALVRGDRRSSRDNARRPPSPAREQCGHGRPPCGRC